MRVSSVHSTSPAPVPAQRASAPAEPLVFFPFAQEAFARAHARRVPVFLLIGEEISAMQDPALGLLLAERTVPVRLAAGKRPDVELLCRRAGALFSGEGALPLCALLLDDARPFLAAPLPPPGFPLDPHRLHVWLSQADRRFVQNKNACLAQAAQVIHSFSSPPLRKPYTPDDAAHDLLRALSAAQDGVSGGFGGVKSPHPCALRFLQHAQDRQAQRMLTRALDAMLSGALYDPLDGCFFSGTLTEDWRVFIPEKPLGVNALLALVLLGSGRRSEAVRLLDSILDFFSLRGGALSPALVSDRESLAFSAEQVCAALGSEDGLRACRLLSLLRSHTQMEPGVTPSRFSPVPPESRRRDADEPARHPRLTLPVTPEDAAFLRRATPALLRVRHVRGAVHPMAHVVTEHCALAAAAFALCGLRLGEARYTQAAQRAVSFLMAQPPAGAAALPASVSPAAPLHAQALCGASAALALAMLTLGKGEGMAEYAQGGLRLLGAALHAFVRPDGVVMHTAKDPAAFFPRVPALCDGELPSPAALLVHALRTAHEMRPQAGYDEAIESIWQAAAPAVHAQPLAHASLIDAVCRAQRTDFMQAQKG